ncbi:SPFH domain-containing protein [Microbispora sp. NPDC088329]|uniref:SPFH domain-containing protein n=1 Tax=Microbispora sp. NPDC088329 TaxID=3154869 RepID=UPI0034483D9E
MTDVSIAVDMPTPQTHERAARASAGWPMLILALLCLLSPAALIPIGAGLAADGDGGAGAVLIAAGALLFLAALVVLTGLTAVAPGEARVIQLLGRYVGTVRTPGLRFVLPFTQKRKVSTRIRNHETDITKVNDADGNPIEMAAVVVWQVEDTAKAVFEVDDFVEFVAFQTETAVRHIAGSYPYDGHDDMLSLRQNADEITGRLSAEIQARVASAGVKVIESRVTRLAYAPEIAQAMLRRQQAGAVVAARQRIVDGAVGMVEAALARLDEHDVIELDEERKATMVSNLLVVLCGDRDVQPVVNTGSLYH